VKWIDQVLEMALERKPEPLTESAERWRLLSWRRRRRRWIWLLQPSISMRISPCGLRGKIDSGNPVRLTNFEWP